MNALTYNIQTKIKFFKIFEHNMKTKQDEDFLSLSQNFQLRKNMKRSG